MGSGVDGDATAATTAPAASSSADPASRGGDATGLDPTDDGAGESTGAPTPAFPTCMFTCVSPDDCAQPSPLYTPDHYACNDGTCAWLGCADDSECQAAYQNPAYRCGEVDGVAVPTCYPACDDVGQCVLATPIYDADNWECSAGRCAWLGCTDDAECQATYQNPSYACVEIGGPTPTCLATCDVADDCIQPSPLYDGENWTCDAGVCRWIGCLDDGECQDALMNPDVVCSE